MSAGDWDDASLDASARGLIATAALLFAEGKGDVLVLGGCLALRDIAAIFRPRLRRPRRHPCAVEGVTPLVIPKPDDVDWVRLFTLAVETLPERQLDAVLTLIDGGRARTLPEVATLLRVRLSTLRGHLLRVRLHHPELWAMVAAVRAAQLAERHEAAVLRQRRHTDRWCWLQHGMERKADALDLRLRRAYPTR